MDFSFEPKQVAFRERVRDFVEREVPKEHARAFEAQDDFPHALLRKMIDRGFHRINIPECYGGDAGNVIDIMIISEELSKRLPVLIWALANIVLYGNSILRVNGSAGQKDLFLPRLARGELKFCFALTEPNAGSDAAAIQTKAEFAHGHWVINGNKMFISGASVADYAVTLTRTGASRYGGITAFLVDTKSPGYSARLIEKLGYHGSDTCEVSYVDVKVLPADVLGGESELNKGWQQEMRLLNEERLLLSAGALGIAGGALEEALSYAKTSLDTRQFRGRLQGVQHRLVEMATELEAARQLAYYAAWKETRQMECIRETSMSKFFAAETAKRVVTSGIGILGRDASAMHYDMQRFLRDVLILSIGGGTTQIQKNIVARTLGL